MAMMDQGRRSVGVPGDVDHAPLGVIEGPAGPEAPGTFPKSPGITATLMGTVRGARIGVGRRRREIPLGDVDGVGGPWPAGVHGAALWHLPGARRAALAIVVEATHGSRWGTCVAPEK